MPFRRYRRRRRRPTRRWRRRRWRRYFRYWHRRPTRRRRYHKWGGHGTEQFKTSVGDPSTIPCPYGPGDPPQLAVRDPSKVHEGVLNAWDYDYDGIVRKDTLKKLLEIPTDSETEKAYPLLGPKTEKLPSSDEEGESDISSSSNSSSEESEEEKRHRRLHHPSKRRLLKHVHRLVKRFKTL
uniref:ORF1/1 n=1 Tax=Torque teno sus virus 1b TaxID=687387 RepID=E2IVK6_9VIRU|nr:ORF1/1 [Torque teno sus virus 1b]